MNSNILPTSLWILLGIAGLMAASSHAGADEPRRLLTTYCLDCHGGDQAEGSVNLAEMLEKSDFDGRLAFTNVATGIMPPVDADQPSSHERRTILEWLATQQKEVPPKRYRRISRHEFVHAVNDLLGTNLDLADEIPEDRGTSDFDTDLRIQLSREMLGTYFEIADRMLNFALPRDGFPNEQTWVTKQLKESHPTYNIYVRDYEDGLLFSWTRANNGNSYSFFYDNFEPPVSGWYEVTLDAAKVGDFPEDVSIQLHAGRYYFADDRPQPQRLLDVISVGNREVESFRTRVFLNPSENVSVHCYSKYTWRNKDPQQGAYIRQLKVRGPVRTEWPPRRFKTLFGDLPVRSIASNVATC